MMYGDFDGNATVVASAAAIGAMAVVLTAAMFPMMFLLALLGGGGGAAGMLSLDGAMPLGSIESLDEPLVWPLEDYGPEHVTSRFGPRNTGIAGASTYHMGIDIGAPEYTPAYAAAGGTVIRSDYNSARGNFVEIDHGSGVTTLYQHLNTRGCSEGDIVLRGQLIGLVGHTGVGSGAHLHFEVKVDGINYDPLLIFNSEKGE